MKVWAAPQAGNSYHQFLLCSLQSLISRILQFTVSLLLSDQDVVILILSPTCYLGMGSEVDMM